MTIDDLLISLGLSSRQSIVPFRATVRDRDDVAVLRCTRSGVIFLASHSHISPAFYETVAGMDYWGADDRSSVLRDCYADDRRRADTVARIAKHKRLLDIGTGAGGFLDLIAPTCASVAAVEPQKGARELLSSAGYRTFTRIEDVEDEFDVITMFHVYEHILDPIGFLRKVRTRLAPAGTLIVEVPHARDVLISFLQCSAFIDHTLWSQHIILHTRESLRAFVSAAGFGGCKIEGLQRYPLANHLHWLSKGKPGGHEAWAFLLDAALDASYAATLARLDLTDTLFAWVSAG